MKRKRMIKEIAIGGLGLVIGVGGIFSYQIGKNIGGGMLEAEKRTRY